MYNWSILIETSHPELCTIYDLIDSGSVDVNNVLNYTKVLLLLLYLEMFYSIGT